MIQELKDAHAALEKILDLAPDAIQRIFLGDLMRSAEIEPGRRLRTFRTASSDAEQVFSQEHTASILGVTTAAVQRWERYRRGVPATKMAGPPGPKNRATIERVIGIPAAHWEPKRS